MTTEWNGMEWNGMEWKKEWKEDSGGNGMEWNGIEWNDNGTFLPFD